MIVPAAYGVSVIISIDVYISSGIELDKRFWNEEEKIAQNHPNAKKKKSLSYEILILLERESCLREGKRPPKRNALQNS